LLFIPISTIIAILIWLEDRGPIFFTQLRVGKNGKVFKLYKFRSMHVNAENLLEGLQSQNQAGDILFKIQDDPRVTKVGKFIRKWSLDELPQLINVIKSEMSLVGPRPALPVEVAKYPTIGHDRHLVKPGITGLWQVSGRSNLNSQEALELDLFYVTNWSVNKDLLILIKTLKAVISKDGAY
jgi:lipopolysaccharide/colanic/teichoic acid biosynthesis glycosyltransferase